MTAIGSTPSTWKLVKVPAIITLVVSLVRLIGELAGGSSALFSTDAGGGGALVGITWLVLVFGLYFGWRLARAGRAPQVMGKALVTILVGIVVVVLLFLVLVGLPPEAPAAEGQPVEGQPVEAPEGQGPEAQQAEPLDTNGFLIFNAAAWICSLATLIAWPALFRALLLYGLAARIPVVIITLLAVAFGWETHHVRLAPGMPEMTGWELAGFASFPQIGFWIPFTVLVGGLFGGIGGLLTRRGGSRAAAVEP